MEGRTIKDLQIKILHRSAPIVLPKSDFREIDDETFG